MIPTPEGFRILKVISREPAGQRELNDPRVQQNIRDMLLNSKDQMLRAAYYEVARNSAKIENYLARSVLENAGKDQVESVCGVPTGGALFVLADFVDEDGVVHLADLDLNHFERLPPAYRKLIRHHPRAYLQVLFQDADAGARWNRSETTW